jgi:hypothetical protein
MNAEKQKGEGGTPIKLTPERVADIRAQIADTVLPALDDVIGDNELRALLDVWEAARKARLIIRDAVDLIQAACPDASTWTDHLADECDEIEVMFHDALGEE